MKKVLITGANGFVGKALCHALADSGFIVHAAVRHKQREFITDHANIHFFHVGELSINTDWQQAIDTVDVVIHTAARVHMLNETADNPQQAYYAVNVAATDGVVQSAIKHNVKQFIFLSSIKVNGEGIASKAYDETDPAQPEDYYAISKYNAEKLLESYNEKIAMTILRCPLIYGVGVKANFAALAKWAEKGIPLPLAGIYNKRSLLYVGNLSSAITCLVSRGHSPSIMYLIADDDTVSTTQLLQYVGSAVGVKVRLFYLPARLMMTIAKIFGKQNITHRLWGSLAIDNCKIKQELDWQPKYTLEQGLQISFSREKQCDK